jgi:quinol monooxygenase YgiN
MIVITAKFRPKPDAVESWPEIVRPFTEATRAEPGCLWFDWSRGVDDPSEYTLIEAFRDDDAGSTHVQSEHFKWAQEHLPNFLTQTPLIVNARAPGESWSELGELAVRPTEQR